MSDLDAEETELLRSTARAAFVGAIELTDLGELGLLGLLTPEGAGGSGWSLAEAVIVAIEGGRALTPLVWTGNLLAAAALAGSEAHSALVEDLLAGTATGSFVERFVDPGASFSVTTELTVPGRAAPDVVVIASAGQLLVANLANDEFVTVVADPEPVDSSRGSQRITLTDSPVTLLEGVAVEAIADAAVILATADTLGALAITTERVIEYLSGRDAFGQPLASFQVLQHRLVDLDVLVAESDALVHEAAEALHDRTENAHRLIQLLHTFFAGRATAALDDCIQLSGGIGVTWEWPVHHALRRAVVNGAVRPSVTLSVDELKGVLDEVQSAGDGTDAFRDRVRSVIAGSPAPKPREGHRAPENEEEQQALRDWYRITFSEGLAGASWPVEWGGDPDYEPIHQLVITEELIRAGVARPIDQVALASHVLLRFGTQEQKAKYLPRIRGVEDVWCQLFSEPGAGSDLAGITTRAEHREDGSWVLSGQKTWTTDGHWAQLGLAIVRTSEESRRHAGLTVFIVPMDAPGVEVHPIPLINGARDINTVFLDGVVLSPENVIGEVGQGWAVAMSGLELERFGVGGNVILLELILRDVIAVASVLPARSRGSEKTIDDPVIRASIQERVAQYVATRAFVSGHIDRVLAGTDGVGEGSIAKIIYTEAYNEIARFGVSLTQTYGPPTIETADGSGRLQDAWLWSRVLTISGGSSEVNRNILAKRRLKLPSAP